MSRSSQSRADGGTGSTRQRAGTDKARDENRQRTRGSWMWRKVGDQVRQDPAGHSEESELDSQRRSLLEGFQ